MKKDIPFTKMVATGNDFLIVDARRLRQRRTLPWKAVSRALCDRHQGIGADGLLVLESSAAADVKMRVFNPDGSEAQMCGNGARCVALYLAQRRRDKGRDAIVLKTRAGRVSAEVRDGRVAMRLMDPTDLRLNLSLDVERRHLQMGFINTGVPHVVVPVADLETVDVNRLGRAIRYHSAFSPRGTNVNFVQPDPGHTNRLRVRTYERGVEEETLSCGTGVAAAALVYALNRSLESGRETAGGNGRGSQLWTLQVQPRSGDILTVSFAIAPDRRGLRAAHVSLEGTAVRVFEGTVCWPLKRHP